MCMRTVDVVINMYTILSELINMKGKVMRHFHLYEDIVNQVSTISTGPRARRLFVAVGPVRASDTQLLLARTGHKVFLFFYHVLYVGPYVGF